MRNQGIAKFDETEPVSGEVEGRPAFVKKAPNPIDRHVGSRVRMRRILLGMSQEKLGEALELTFQQVQKYEKGTNRIGASRLQQISQILNVPPAFFFDGAPASEGTAASEATQAQFAEEDEGSTYIVDFLSTTEGVRLNKAFARIHNPKVRKRIIDLVTSLADEDDAEEPETGKTPAK